MRSSDVRVIHTAAELNNQASGPSHSIPALLYWLNRLGVDVELQALQPEPERKRDFPQVYYDKWKLFESFGVSPSMRRELNRKAASADIIHTHNLWMMPNIYPYRAAARNGCRMVITPRGTLTTWAMAYRRWKKALVWTTMQKRVVMNADCIHATSDDEISDLRSLGVTAPIALIPNGVDVPAADAASEVATPRKLLFLGRIHPKKGIERLLASWKELHRRHPEWTLEIVGPDNIGHLAEMKSLAKDLQMERCYFKPPVFGNEKTRTYQSASLFVLPTHSENFGIAVAEALACGVPAVVTHGAPWGGLHENDCGWWVNGSPDALSDVLDQAMSLSPSKLSAMGNNGRQWMHRDFSWETIAGKMKRTYEWLVDGGEAPEWIFFDDAVARTRSNLQA